MAAASVDVSPFVEQQRRRLQLPPPSRLPEHRAPMGPHPPHPFRLLAQHAAQDIQVAPPGRGDADLQKVAGLACEQGHLGTLFTSAKTAHTLWTNSWWLFSKPIPPSP